MTISELYNWTSGLLFLTEKVRTSDAWIFAYDALFSDAVMDQAKRLGVTWIDPDAGYEDDVRAFCQAVEEAYQDAYVHATHNDEPGVPEPRLDDESYSHRLTRPTVAAAREEAKPKLAVEWACAVLDVGSWKYDRKGWRDVARVGARKVSRLVTYIAVLEAALKDKD